MNTGRYRADPRGVCETQDPHRFDPHESPAVGCVTLQGDAKPARKPSIAVILLAMRTETGHEQMSDDWLQEQEQLSMRRLGTNDEELDS